MSGRFKPPGQCPACGEWVCKGAAACEECGACEKSGWSGNTEADGLDLPDEDFDYDDFVAREFGGRESKKPQIANIWWWAALLVLLALVLGALLPVLT